MNFKYLFYILLTVIVLTLACSFAKTFAFPDSNWPLDKGERITVLPAEIVTQPFSASEDGLRRIEVLLGKFTLQDNDELLLELRDHACSSVLAQETLSGKSFDSEYTYHFLFDRIANSKDQTYCLTVTFNTNRPIAKDKAPRLFNDKSAPNFPHTVTNPGGEKTTGAQAIAIRPGYTNDSFIANAKEFFDRISQYKPFFLKSWFLITFAVLGIVLTFLVTALLIREEE